MYFDFQLHFSLPISISRVSATWYWPFCPWFLPGLDPGPCARPAVTLGLAHRSCPHPHRFRSRPRRCIAAAEVSTWWCCRRGSSPGRRAHSALCLEWLWCGRGEQFTQGPAQSDSPQSANLLLVILTGPAFLMLPHLSLSRMPMLFQEPPHLNEVLFHIFRKCRIPCSLPFLVFPTCNVLLIPLFYERSAHTL